MDVYDDMPRHEVDYGAWATAEQLEWLAAQGYDGWPIPWGAIKSRHAAELIRRIIADLPLWPLPPWEEQALLRQRALGERIPVETPQGTATVGKHAGSFPAVSTSMRSRRRGRQEVYGCAVSARCI